MLLKIFIAALTIHTVFAEVPISRPAPYASSGWRPIKPFDLPRDYIAPAELAKQQQRRPGSQTGLEITKARVVYVGQVQDNVYKPNIRQPQQEFLPVNALNSDDHRIQDLPLEVILQQYTPQTERQPFELPTQSQQPFLPRPQRPQYKPQNESPRIPANKYGSPSVDDFNIVYPDPEPRNFEDIDSMQTFSGSDADDYDPNENERPNRYMRAKQGQYFVIGPDNTLQRVVFTATQDEEEQRTNGFTAKLKYTPVGELRDPVFKYNNRGQLVRVLKKK